MSSEEVTYRGYFADQVSVFLLHARELSLAAASLEVPKYGLARGLLLGQSLELVLKAWLIGRQLNTEKSPRSVLEKVRNKYGHDLELLWRASALEGLELDESLPYWVDLLAGAHGKPYANRYPACSDAFRTPTFDECSFVTQLTEVVCVKLGKRLQWE